MEEVLQDRVVSVQGEEEVAERGVSGLDSGRRMGGGRRASSGIGSGGGGLFLH